MLIKGLKTEINNVSVEYLFPEKKSIVLHGDNAIQILHVIECLINTDFTDFYKDVDASYGYTYYNKTGVSQLVFINGWLTGQDKSVVASGVIPKLHTIRYLAKGNKIRSSFVNSDVNNTELYQDVMHDVSSLDNAKVCRLILMANKIIGYEFVRLGDKGLVFDFDTPCELSEDGRKIIFMILSECMQTPQGYRRVVLLPDIPCLSGEYQIKLIEALDNIAGHALTLSAGNININDFGESTAVTLLNV